MKFRTKILLFFLLPGTVVSFFFIVKGWPANNTKNKTQQFKPSEGKALFTQYCSTCHIVPAPERLPKEVWSSRVLPVMAVKMGLKDDEYIRNISEEERKIENEHHLIPENPMISAKDFDKISDYILANAPDSIPYATERLNRNKNLKQFTLKNIKVDNNIPSLITSLQFDSIKKTLWIGNYYNQVQHWKWTKGLLETIQVQSPVVHFTLYQDNIFFTQIGDITPSELSKGMLAYSNGSRSAPILTSLHRPVYTEVEDLNGDNIPEILVCNFGKNIGSLSLYRKKSPSEPFTEQIVLPLPGATKAYIKDMNGDGKKDIVTLIAQADETVYIFYNKGNLEFEKKAVLQFPPDYGTTDIVLFDYNKDGLLDILTAHGDNADYSIILKPYHGVRLHINEGNDDFKERFFFPLYGVTKILAEDFDKDGDIDFAASAFYPDYGLLLNESFIYLENKNSSTYNFQSFTLKSDQPIRSLTLEKADIDGDGDMDIIMGNFAYSPVAAPAELEKKWKEAPNGLILLINGLR